MNYQPSRTDIFEAHQAAIADLRERAMSARTVARAYTDLADIIEELPTKGELWDSAKYDVVLTTRKRASDCVRMCTQHMLNADKLEDEGIDHD